MDSPENEAKFIPFRVKDVKYDENSLVRFLERKTRERKLRLIAKDGKLIDLTGS